MLRAREAAQFLRPRQRRAYQVFEEAKQGHLERECIEELCSKEEAREVFENDPETVSAGAGCASAVPGRWAGGRCAPRLGGTAVRSFRADRSPRALSLQHRISGDIHQCAPWWGPQGFPRHLRVPFPESTVSPSGGYKSLYELLNMETSCSGIVKGQGYRVSESRPTLKRPPQLLSLNSPGDPQVLWLAGGRSTSLSGVLLSPCS